MNTFSIFVVSMLCLCCNNNRTSADTPSDSVGVDTLRTIETLAEQLAIESPIKRSTSPDTVYYDYPPDTILYEFDTTLNNIAYVVRTYCLNDSAVYNQVYSMDGKDKKLVEYSVNHNYATDFTIKSSDSEKRFTLTKYHFRDSLPADFLSICHMWKNEFETIEDGRLIFRATLAKPETDYQMAVLYAISTQGKYRIIQVVDESCCYDDE